MNQGYQRTGREKTRVCQSIDAKQNKWLERESEKRKDGKKNV